MYYFIRIVKVSLKKIKKKQTNIPKHRRWHCLRSTSLSHQLIDPDKTPETALKILIKSELLRMKLAIINQTIQTTDLGITTHGYLETGESPTANSRFLPSRPTTIPLNLSPQTP